jgi:hypothetical protein
LVVDDAVRGITKKLESEIRRIFSGKKLPNSSRGVKSFRNFDIKRTIKKNLKNYSEEYGTIIAETLCFNRNVKRYNPWHIIILVDESGSMLDSVIYSAVMAADIIESGAKLFVLPALDYEGRGAYDKGAAQRLRNLGAETAALSPEQLAEWIGRVIG